MVSLQGVFEGQADVVRDGFRKWNVAAAVVKNIAVAKKER